MNNLFSFDNLISDGAIWLALITINMTIIGLTSLAETKRVIGVDYGKFLIRKYRVGGCVRIYYLLVVFAIINVISLFSMFVQIDWFKLVNFAVLILSSIFAIYYFFNFILVENRGVKRQIFMDEVLGMYYKSDDVTTFYPDLLTNMKNGWRTQKKISSYLVHFFNRFNTDTQIAFEELFGPHSILYDNSKKVINYWNKKFKLVPFDYSADCGLNHISHEFFQMYRASDMQDKWILEILYLFNKSYTDSHKEMRIDNLLRVLAHLNKFGKSENLYKYKFLENLMPYIHSAFCLDDKNVDIDIPKRKEKELFVVEQICEFIMVSNENYYDKNFEQWGCKLLSEIVIGENFNCFTTDVERLQVILNYYSKFDTQINEKTLLRILSIFVDKKNISIDDLNNLGLYCKKQKSTQQDIEKLHNWLNAN